MSSLDDILTRIADLKTTYLFLKMAYLVYHKVYMQDYVHKTISIKTELLRKPSRKFSLFNNDKKQEIYKTKEVRNFRNLDLRILNPTLRWSRVINIKLGFKNCFFFFKLVNTN